MSREGLLRYRRTWSIVIIDSMKFCSIMADICVKPPRKDQIARNPQVCKLVLEPCKLTYSASTEIQCALGTYIRSPTVQN